MAEDEQLCLLQMLFSIDLKTSKHKKRALEVASDILERCSKMIDYLQPSSVPIVLDELPKDEKEQFE